MFVFEGVPNKNYQRGYALENKARKILEESGWTVVRSPASKGAADLYAFKEDAKLVVQCKKTFTVKLTAYELDSLLDAAVKLNAKPLIVYSFYNHPVYAAELSANRMRLNKNAAHVRLEAFLKNEELSYEHGQFVVE